MSLCIYHFVYKPVAEFLLTKSCDSSYQLLFWTSLVHLFSCLFMSLKKPQMEISSLLFLSFICISLLWICLFLFSPEVKTVWLLFLGHEGDPCLRSSDCIEGHCCARHFWTKICKPVLHQGEVCTKQRKKGSHGLEIFQRCDCAKGLSCKVWKDATSSSKSRLHVCQKIWRVDSTKY